MAEGLAQRCGWRNSIMTMEHSGLTQELGKEGSHWEMGRDGVLAPLPARECALGSCGLSPPCSLYSFRGKVGELHLQAWHDLTIGGVLGEGREGRWGRG